MFAIWLTRNRLVNPIPSNWHESFPLLLIQHAGSRFACDLENIADLGLEGGLKMLSIRVDSIESTRVFSPADNWTCRKSICADNVGWVEDVVNLTWFDQIDTNPTNQLKFVAMF